MANKKMDDTTFQAGASRVNENDAKRVVDNSQSIFDKVLNNDLLKRFIVDVTELVEMVRDFVTGEYKDAPWTSIAAMVFTLLYLLNPLDIIPDVIPIIGLTDDMAAIALCLQFTLADRERYRTWRAAKESKTVNAETNTSNQPKD